MYKGHRIAAVLLMGGRGVRFGGSIPKQFVELGGKPIYRFALETMERTGVFDRIVCVCSREWMVEGGIEGGKTRQESSYRGVEAVKGADVVLIHDAVRPFVSEEILKANVDGAIAWGAVDTCIPSADTLVYAPGGKEIVGIPNRAEYLRGQTPQTFRYDWIWEAHEKAKADGIENATDDCQLVMRLGNPVHVVTGSEENFKVTTEFDLLLAERALAKSIHLSLE